MMVSFNEELHKYTNSKGIVYTSATQFIGKFYKHFEDVEDFWLLYKSLQYTSDISTSKIKKYDEDLHKVILKVVGGVLFTEKQYGYYSRIALREYKEDVLSFKNAFDESDYDMLIYNEYGL